MPAIQCPSCGAAIKYNPDHAGLAAVCPRCNGAFKVPHPRGMPPSEPWSPPEFIAQQQREEIPTTSPYPPGFFSKFDKWNVHWTKKLMLVVTILWPLTCLGCGCMVTHRAHEIDRPAGNGLVYNPRTGNVTDEHVARAGTGAAIVLTWIMVTACYLSIMFFLFVLWFVTKP